MTFLKETLFFIWCYVKDTNTVCDTQKLQKEIDSMTCTRESDTDQKCKK